MSADSDRDGWEMAEKVIQQAVRGQQNEEETAAMSEVQSTARTLKVPAVRCNDKCPEKRLCNKCEGVFQLSADRAPIPRMHIKVHL